MAEKHREISHSTEPKTASLGRGHLVNKSLIDLCNIADSGLMVRDVKDVDKQDDGAARRLFHTTALTALTVKDPETNDEKICDGFHGLFAFCIPFHFWYVSQALVLWPSTKLRPHIIP